MTLIVSTQRFSKQSEIRLYLAVMPLYWWCLFLGMNINIVEWKDSNDDVWTALDSFLMSP